MSRRLCLTRQCLGLTIRIEGEVRPLDDGRGLWMLLCAAGMPAAQPSAIKVQGPFHGACAAEAVLDSIGECLLAQGYRVAPEPMIWALHLRAELRRLNGRRRWQSGRPLSHPER